MTEIAAALHEIAHAEVGEYEVDSEKKAWDRAEELFKKAYMFVALDEQRDDYDSIEETGLEDRFTLINNRLFRKMQSIG